ncbi:MAG: YfcE family phosphodiesterase [Clostridia bacterium]|nr:YfcE family phosphodiesterase [Clostridia bacterium]
MRIIVISDSHGRWSNVVEAIDNEPSAEVVYFLGDGVRDYEDAQSIHAGSKAFIGVRGNCDMYCDLPFKDIRTLENKKIYATHGHCEHVKYGIEELKHLARKEGCDIVLYGHTHEALSTYEDGLYIFNPGTMKYGQYGVIDITPNGIICFNKYLSSY